jgi:uncharacterized protein (DUF427 family)
MIAVRDFPRPPRIEPETRLVRIVFAGVTIAETDSALRVLETFHPPSYYLPPAAFAPGVLTPSRRGSFCEWKGAATYWNVTANGITARDVGWSYPSPLPGFEPITDHVAVYAAAMEACFVGDEKVRPQPGGFYGGWITGELEGPFKGEPGTNGW